MNSTLSLYNGMSVPLDTLPKAPLAAFRTTILERVGEGGRIVSLFGAPSGGNGAICLYAVLAGAYSSGLSALRSEDVTESYPALTSECVQANWFEREIAEQWGVRPEGHPWLKPVRFHRSYRAGRDAWSRGADAAILPCVTDFYRVEGEEVHEVAVGPVHAGIIEPGHFRFQCHGENVMHLEISLGYQHRGIERALMGGPGKRTMHFMETLAGDTSAGHALAYCQIVEALTGTKAPYHAQELRGIALELERLANHTGDLGALAGDVGYLPTASFCGRLRGDFLNMTAMLCGSRFGRGLIRPGGVGFDAGPELRDALREKLDATLKDTAGAVELLWKTPSVMARFEETGLLTPQTAVSLGLVGVAARACGLNLDVRTEFPADIYRFAHVPIAVWESGDVFARAYVRWDEMVRSAAFIRERLAGMSEGPIRAEVTQPPAANAFVVSLVEGWRGEICHTAITDAEGRIAQYKVVDPSFHNWMGLALALRDQQISDFPLCNKSFNLSYCGFDL